MSNGVLLSRPGNSYRVGKLLKELPMVRLERMLGFGFSFLGFVFFFPLFYFFLRCF